MTGQRVNLRGAEKKQGMNFYRFDYCYQRRRVDGDDAHSLVNLLILVTGSRMGEIESVTAIEKRVGFGSFDRTFQSMLLKSGGQVADLPFLQFLRWQLLTSYILDLHFRTQLPFLPPLPQFLVLLLHLLKCLSWYDHSCPLRLLIFGSDD